MSKIDRKHYADLLLESVDSKLKVDGFLTKSILRYVFSDSVSYGSAPKSILANGLNVRKKDLEGAIKFLVSQKLMITVGPSSDWVAGTEAGRIYNNAELKKEFGKYNINWEGLEFKEFQNILKNLNGEFETVYTKTFAVGSASLRPLYERMQEKIISMRREEQNFISELINNGYSKSFDLSCVSLVNPAIERNNIALDSVKIPSVMNYTTLESALNNGVNKITGTLKDTNKKFLSIDNGYFPLKVIANNLEGDSEGDVSLTIRLSLGPKSNVWQQSLDYQYTAVHFCINSINPVRDLYKKKKNGE